MQRGFHRSMGEAYRVFELSEAKAYKHLRAAYEIEAPVPETQIELMLSVAELAEAMGTLMSPFRFGRLSGLLSGMIGWRRLLFD